MAVYNELLCGKQHNLVIYENCFQTEVQVKEKQNVKMKLHIFKKLREELFSVD